MRHLPVLLAAAALLCACAQAQPPARPAIADTEPDVTAQVQAVLGQVAGGTFSPSVLTENARAALTATELRDAERALSACGPAPALELLDRQTKGEDRLYTYRVPCAGKPLVLEIGFGKGARINRLQLRPQ